MLLQQVGCNLGSIAATGLVSLTCARLSPKVTSGGTIDWIYSESVELRLISLRLGARDYSTKLEV
jgi:hypothetical protein